MEQGFYFDFSPDLEIEAKRLADEIATLDLGKSINPTSPTEILYGLDDPFLSDGLHSKKGQG